MNEKEAIEILNTIQDHLSKICSCHSDPDNVAGHLWHGQEVSYMEDIIEWLQRRADIIELANNPPETWDKREVPYIYDLANFLQKEAHYALDMFIMFPKMEHCLERTQHDAKLAAKYMRECAPDGPRN